MVPLVELAEKEPSAIVAIPWTLYGNNLKFLFTVRCEYGSAGWRRLRISPYETQQTVARKRRGCAGGTGSKNAAETKD